MTDHRRFAPVVCPAEVATITVDGVPVPWMRAGKNGKRHFTQPRMAAQQERVAYAFNTAVGRGWRPDGMFHVSYEFVLPDWRVVDLDNLKKLANDALNGLAWVDDSRIMEDPGRKVVDPTRPSCTRITITRIGDWPVKQRPSRRAGMSVEGTLPVLERVQPSAFVPGAPNGRLVSRAELEAMYPAAKSGRRP